MDRQARRKLKPRKRHQSRAELWPTNEFGWVVLLASTRPQLHHAKVYRQSLALSKEKVRRPLLLPRDLHQRYHESLLLQRRIHPNVLKRIQPPQFGKQIRPSSKRRRPKVRRQLRLVRSSQQAELPRVSKVLDSEFP